MADVLLNFIEQTPASGLAVGGAIVAAAVGFTAVKAFSGGKAAPAAGANAQKKKKKAKAAKKKAEVDQAPTNQADATPEINLDDFVTNDPDTEDEEAARAEKKKLKRKLKKKNASIKAKTAAQTVSSSSEVDVTDKKKAAAAALKKDAEDGWATVKTKKAPKSKQN